MSATGPKGAPTAARTITKPTEAQILDRLVTSIEGAIDLWLDQERRITVAEMRLWQGIIRNVAQQLKERGL